jgi:hypothetical protein
LGTQNVDVAVEISTYGTFNTCQALFMHLCVGTHSSLWNYCVVSLTSPIVYRAQLGKGWE